MLTFEKIRELEHAERDSKELQALPENIMDELKDYIHRKEKSSDPLEIENVKSTVKRLFEIRERKLLELALYSVRTGLPPENLTQAEESIFNAIIDNLKKFRENFFEELRKKAPVEKKVLYKVKKTVPAFVGPDSKTYEFKENDTLDIKALPKELNDLLLKEGVIEKIEE